MSPIEQIPKIDLYRELEVDPAASPETIAAAYRSLMKRVHPDVAGPDGAGRATRLNLAREWLMDPERKRRYDSARSKVTWSTGSGSAGSAAGAARRAGPASAAGPAGAARPAAATRPAPRPAGASWTKPVRGPAPTEPPAWIAALLPDRLPSVPPDWSVAFDRALNDRAHLVAIGLLGAALVLLGLGVVQAAAPRPDDTALAGAGLVAPTPTLFLPPTPPPATPVPTPVRTATPAPTTHPTPAATPRPTAAAGTKAPVAASSGRADLRLSGLHTEHYVQPLRGFSSCLSTVDPVTSVRTITGFYLESNGTSHASWTLNLDGVNDAWSMDMYFPDTADALWWDATTGPGSVQRTPTGFTVDVTLTDDTHNLRIEGTVTCG